MYKLSIKNLLRGLSMFAVVVLLSACTSATGKMTPQPGAKDTYAFKIYLGGVSGKKVADQKATLKIKEAMKQGGYKSYKIISATSSFFPHYYKYTVKFSK